MVTTITIKSSFSWTCVELREGSGHHEAEALNLITSGGGKSSPDLSTVGDLHWWPDFDVQTISYFRRWLYKREFSIVSWSSQRKKKSLPLCEKGIACKTRFPEVLR